FRLVSAVFRLVSWMGDSSKRVQRRDNSAFVSLADFDIQFVRSRLVASSCVLGVDSRRRCSIVRGPAGKIMSAVKGSLPQGGSRLSLPARCRQRTDASSWKVMPRSYEVCIDLRHNLNGVRGEQGGRAGLNGWFPISPLPPAGCLWEWPASTNHVQVQTV